MTGEPNQARGRFADSGSLLSALDAVTNLRAFATLAGTFVLFALAATVLGGVTGYLVVKAGVVGGLLGLISVLICAGILLVGLTATGIHVSDDVWERNRRGMADALLAATFTAHRLVAVALLEGIIFVAYLIVLAALLFVCKLPGLGPLLYAIALPLGAIATGFVVFALFYVMLPLAAPAVWNGSSIVQALAMLKEVARTKLLYVVVMNLLLGFLVAVAFLIVGSILFAGTSTVLSLSVAIVGVTGGMDASNLLMALMTGPGGFGDGAGYGVALGFGFGVLFLLGAIPSTLIFMKGLAIIYRGAIADLALGDAEAALRQEIDTARQRIQEARKHAVSPAPQDTESVSLAAVVCPGCAASMTADDLFCGECGHKLA